MNSQIPDKTILAQRVTIKYKRVAYNVLLTHGDQHSRSLLINRQAHTIAPVHNHIYCRLHTSSPGSEINTSTIKRQVVCKIESVREVVYFTAFPEDRQPQVSIEAEK